MWPYVDQSFAKDGEYFRWVVDEGRPRCEHRPRDRHDQKYVDNIKVKYDLGAFDVAGADRRTRLQRAQD